MKKMINQVHGEGYLYEHNLEKKTSKKGVDYIGGTISLATDENCTNIVKFEMVYVVPTYAKSGKPNPTYKVLENIINSKDNTIMSGNKDNALKLRIDSSIELNEWYDKNTGELISNMRNSGGFVNTAPSLNTDETKRNTFKTDILITGIFRKEANEETGEPEKATVKGAIFNFTNALLPISFTVYNPNAIDYFEKLEPSASKPIPTTVWGNIVSQEIVKTFETESAFGETLIEERTSSKREYVINGAKSEIFEWDSEDFITATELKECMSAREIHLAEIKKNAEEYAKQQSNPATPSNNNVVSAAKASTNSEFVF